MDIHGIELILVNNIYDTNGGNSEPVVFKTKLKAKKGIITPIGRPENLENEMIWLE